MCETNNHMHQEYRNRSPCCFVWDGTLVRFPQNRGDKTGTGDKEPLLDAAQETAWHFAVEIPQIPYKPMQDAGPCLDRLDWHCTSVAWSLGPLGRRKYLMVWMGGLTPERFYYSFYWYLVGLSNQIPLPLLHCPGQELLDGDTLSRLQWDALSCCQ